MANEQETKRAEATGRRRVQVKAQVKAQVRTVADAISRNAVSGRARAGKVIAAVAADGRRVKSTVAEAKAGRRLPVKAQVWRLRHLVAAARADRTQDENQKQAHLEAAKKPLLAAVEFDVAHDKLEARHSRERSADEREIDQEVNRLEAVLDTEWKSYAHPTARDFQSAQGQLYEAINSEVTAREAYDAAADTIRVTENLLAGLPKKAPDTFQHIVELNFSKKRRANAMARYEQAVVRRTELDATLDEARATLEEARPGLEAAKAHVGDCNRAVEELASRSRATSLKLDDSFILRRNAERDSIRKRRADLAKGQAKELREHAKTRKASITKVLG